MVSYSTNFGNASDGTYLRIHGEKGNIHSEGSELWLTGEGGIRKESDINGRTLVQDIELPDHFLDWLQCMRTRRQPLAPIEAGYQHTVACLMAVRACDTGTRMVYDREKRVIHAG